MYSIESLIILVDISIISFFNCGLLYGLEGHEQFLIESLLNSMIRCQIVNRLPPAVLMIRSDWKFVGFLRIQLLFHMKMAIPFGFLVVVILIFLKLVQLMSLLQAMIGLLINGQIAGDIILHQLL